jgi:PAS domain S-box-containing protein
MTRPATEMTPKSDATASRPDRLRFVTRWRSAWESSLRFRLLALGLMPLLIAFPFVIAVLLVVGGDRANSLLMSNLRSNLAGARNYLDQAKNEAGVRVGQLVKSDRLIQLLQDPNGKSELNRVLATTAKGSGFDFLMIATPQGEVIAASSGVLGLGRLPESHVIRQARIGLANSAYERFDAAALRIFSPDFPQQAHVEPITPLQNGEFAGETHGLLITAAAHFPLDVHATDAILVGGILLNRNFSLVEHMREIIFPVGMLPGEAEGMTSIYTDTLSIAISRQRKQGQRTIGQRVPNDVAAAVIGDGEAWLGRVEFAGESYLTGYEPLHGSDGHHIGMIGVGFPDAAYRHGFLLLLGMVASVLALTMLGISLLFLWAGRDLTQRLEKIGQTMVRVRQGDRGQRVGTPSRDDELGQLSRHFDALLDTIAKQDAMQLAAQQTILDEASRRRALFEHERDGVIILNEDGTVFEANPKAASMLGYTGDQIRQLSLSAWETRAGEAGLADLLLQHGGDGHFFESVHRRRDGSTFPAEVSVSPAKWADRRFVLFLLRDISERKAAEAELEQYRIGLEKLVDQRTLELNERSEQLNTIFALSPDGFVSFDRAQHVTFANLAFLRMTGLAASDIHGLHETDFSEQLARLCLTSARFAGVAALRAARQKASDSGDEAQSRRHLVELSGPGGRVLEVSIRMAEGSTISQVLYFRDVTYEMEVDRMKSEFLSTAAHELRTPMASIFGYSEVLLMQEFDKEIQNELLTTIYRQSGLMASIINELLDLARIEARRGKDFVLERLDAQAVVAEAVAGYKPPAGRDGPVVDASAVPLGIQADRNKMQQALLNVLSNAYKYSPQGGEVRIVCRPGAADDSGVNRVCMEISDTGIGMTPEQLGRVFERFYRADTSGKIPGTGLGMSIVKEIVELHGGEVTLASTPGAGTTVKLWLPLA